MLHKMLAKNKNKNKNKTQKTTAPDMWRALAATLAT